MKNSHAYKLGYQAIADVNDNELEVEIPKDANSSSFIDGLKEACEHFDFDFNRLTVEKAA